MIKGLARVYNARPIRGTEKVGLSGSEKRRLRTLSTKTCSCTSPIETVLLWIELRGRNLIITFKNLEKMHGERQIMLFVLIPRAKAFACVDCLISLQKLKNHCIHCKRVRKGGLFFKQRFGKQHLSTNSHWAAALLFYMLPRGRLL